MLNQLTEQKKKDLLEYMNKTPFLMSLLYDINLLPEQVTDEPLKQHYMFGMITMYKLLNDK